MKLNWGNYMAIAMGAFAVFIVSMGIKMYRGNIDLESSNYYNLGLEYDKRLEMEKNSEDLETPLNIDYNEKESVLNLRFPREIPFIEGKLIFYRPDNKKSDLPVEITGLIDHSKALSTEKLKPGLWYVKVLWKGESKSYYCEKPLIIQ